MLRRSSHLSAKRVFPTPIGPATAHHRKCASPPAKRIRARSSSSRPTNVAPAANGLKESASSRVKRGSKNEGGGGKTTFVSRCPIGSAKAPLTRMKEARSAEARLYCRSKVSRPEASKSLHLLPIKGS